MCGPGEVHALVGENGAGKSTLIKIIAGVISASSGEVYLDGKAAHFSSPKEANARGIATVYQEMLLFQDLTVAENIFLGHAPKNRFGAPSIGGPCVPRRGSLLDSLDSHDLDVDAVVGTLSIANRQRVEIAKALSQEARIVIMDEPTAALVESDARRLLDIVLRLRDQGVGVIYVSHRMKEIFAVADRISVLRDGALVKTCKREEVDQPTLVSMMVGRSIDQLYPKVDVTPGETLLETRHLTQGTRVRDVSIQLAKGEILGIAGLVGAGRTELALALFGITPATSGEILIDGQSRSITSPRMARGSRHCLYAPKTAVNRAWVKPQTIAENIIHPILDRVSRYFVVDRRQERERAKIVRSSSSPFVPGVGEQIVGELSGGNQQKVCCCQMAEHRAAHSHHGRTDPRH